MSEKKNNDDIEIDDLEKTELVIEIKPVKKPVIEETQVNIVDVDKEIEEIQQKLNEITKFIDENEERIWDALNNIFCDRRHVKSRKDSNEYIDIVYCIDLPFVDRREVKEVVENLFNLAYKYRNVAEIAYIMIDEVERCERDFKEPNMIIFDDPVRMVSYYRQYFISENTYIHYIDLFYIFDTRKGEVIRVKLRGKGEEDIKMEEICYQDRRTENLITRIIDFMHNYTYLPCLRTDDCV